MKEYIISGVVIVVLAALALFVFDSDRVKESESVDKTGIDDKNLETQNLENIVNDNNVSVNVGDEESINSVESKKFMNATLYTNYGDIKIEFFEKDAPKTVENFTKLADSKFYDGVKFHRVIKGFMIQGGDPFSKDDSKIAMWGTGGPGYKFNDEINAQSDLYTKTGYKKGIVAMANSGTNTNGSQFFIMHADYPLPPLYTIFGKVVSGQDVVDKIALVATGPNDRPIEPVVIKNISLK